MDGDGLADAARIFLSARSAERDAAGQRVALQLACGLDIDAVLGLDDRGRRKVLDRIGRQIERERLKGLVRHWSYDLNRHIALKQAAERLLKSLPALNGDRTVRPAGAGNANGARRRRL